MKWTKVGENLVRHPAGTIYLRAKVGGRKVRISLETTDVRTAKRKRDLKIEDLRHAAALGEQNIETIGEALALEKELTLSKPKLKDKTREYYGYLFAKIKASIPDHKKAANWTAEDARKREAVDGRGDPAGDGQERRGEGGTARGEVTCTQ